MADTKFTPGPWQVGFPDGTGRKKDADFGIYIIAPEIYNNPELMRKTTSDGVVVRGASGKHAQTVPQGIWNEADGHLIAAAPELYVALEKAVEELGFAWKHEAESGGDFADDYRLALVNGQAALRKARGEA